MNKNLDRTVELRLSVRGTYDFDFRVTGGQFPVAGVGEMELTNDSVFWRFSARDLLEMLSRIPPARSAR